VSVKLKSPNALNFFGIRRLRVPSPYLEYVSIPLRYNLEESIVKWILDNQKGRFYVGKGIELIDNSLTNVVKIGFEDPKELSFFTLACPLLKYK